MSKHTLFICKSCHRSSEKLSKNQLSDGTRLLEQLNNLVNENLPSSQLEIQPIQCLWACSRGCVTAVSCPEKPTYLLVDLPPDESAAALLELMQMYINNDKGAFIWKNLSQLLQSAIFAQIPSVVSESS